MATMTVPPGCTGLEIAGGTKYNADRNGRVQVADRHVDAVRRHYGPLGIIDVRQPTALGTKGTRWCLACTPAGRAWQAWTLSCPRCGNPTTSNEGATP